MLHALEVADQGGSVVRGVEAYDGRLEQRCREQSPDFCDGDVVFEPWVAERVHPVEAVVVTVVMVHRRVMCRRETDIHAGDPGEVLEGGEIAAGAYGADMAVPGIPYRLARYRLVRRRYQRCNFVQRFVQQRRSREPEQRTPRTDIDVYVRDCGGGEPGQVFLDPLRRTHQSIFFSVPAREDDCAEGFPAFFERGAERADDFVKGGGAAVRVPGAAGDPGVAVVA